MLKNGKILFNYFILEKMDGIQNINFFYPNWNRKKDKLIL